MVRKISAVVLGIVIAIAIVAAVESLGHAVYPVPPDVRFDDPAQYQAYVAGLPAGALMFVLAAWVLGALIGGLIACLVAREKPFLYSTIIGGAILAATVMNLVMIPHPLWFSVTAIMSIAAITFLTGLIASSRAFAKANA